MDYNLLYENTYEKYFSLAEKLIKENCIKYKNEGFAFNYTYNKIQKNSLAYTESINNILQNEKMVSYSKLFSERFQIFEDDVILNIIDKRIKPLLIKNKDLAQFNLEHFVYTNAKIDAIKSASRIFSNFNRLFELMFKLNDFRKFNLIEYKSNVENIPLFNKLRERLYPSTKASKSGIPMKIVEEDEYLNVQDVSQLTNYAVTTIYDLKHKGMIPFYKNGAKLQFKKSEIIAWMDHGKGTTKKDLEAKADEYIFKNS